MTAPNRITAPSFRGPKNSSETQRQSRQRKRLCPQIHKFDETARAGDGGRKPSLLSGVTLP